MLLLSLLALAPLALQDTQRPDPVELVTSARALLPVYDGEPDPPLGVAVARDVRAAAGLLEAAVELDPASGYAHWWRGRAELLLAGEAARRGDDAEAARRRARATESLERSIALDPASAWGPFALGTALERQGALPEALERFEAAARIAEERIGDETDESLFGDERYVLFRARQWHADARMRLLECDAARGEFRAFYAAYGNNRWDLGYSLAETFLRERDLASAREVYEGLLADPELATYSATYEQLGYLEGLAGDDAAGVAWLRRSLEHEQAPGLYPRLWLLLLGQGDERERARAELEDFVAHPPPDLSAWDALLGRFALGDGSQDTFLAAAEAERARRLDAGEPVDDVVCEGWFYAGMRAELDAEAIASHPERSHELLAAALEAHRRALVFRPRPTKWEHEYARLHLARLAERLGRTAAPGFTVVKQRLALEPDAPLLSSVTPRAGALERVLRHVPGEERPHTDLPDLGALRPGELLQCLVRTDDGALRVVALVVDAR